MYVSYKWLEQYVDLLGISPSDLAEKITRSGIEVESVETLNEGIKGVVIGHVLEKNQHPDADKLNVCLVDIGGEDAVQIVCGAPNVDKGQKVIVAKVGAVLPGNFKIKKAKLRGEQSHGMICSLQELGVEGKLVAKEYAEGIFVFPENVEVGADALAQLHLDDTVLELGLTPNRADALSMLGVAHEVAAILDKEVSYPPTEHQAVEKRTDATVAVSVEDAEANPLYIAKVVENVKIAPSPLWLQARLMAAGIRPHNNVVDITNFILLEYGTPLHAFDYDRISSKEVLVRFAKQGESLTTLDEVERTLSSDQLVITDGREPIALAGVMGGANTEVQSDTTNVLIEAAYFNPESIRRSVKAHNLRSEASTRFEKGIDPSRVRLAAERAAKLLQELAGGSVLKGSVEVDTYDWKVNTVTTTVGKVNATLGTNITQEEVSDIFRRLQFDVEIIGEKVIVHVPSRRGDISIEEDLIEEVARLYGYDNIPTTLPVGERTPGQLTTYQQKRRKVRRFLEGAGLYQAITYSLSSEQRAKQFALEDSELTKLALPMSEDRSALRLSLIPHLIEALKHNIARQSEKVALFEIGSVFLKENETLTEKERLSGALTGLWESHPWQGEKKPLDFFVAKGIVDGVLQTLNVLDLVEYKQAKRQGLHPGRTAEIIFDGKLIGYIGQLHPTVQKEHDLQETYVFELALESLMNVIVPELEYKAIPKYPSISRDIALVVDQKVVAGDLEEQIRVTGGNLLKKVSIFDVYEGEHLPEGKKSIAYRLTYLDPQKTLTDEEVTSKHEKVLKVLEEKFAATLRS
ncbi:phenylalanine--tRNA ligase subunit beta [Bacillus carboniphilus]|uniref:Phenylalanine--tRNA ligase beta subunit n=1 Tax=Bacillus carboniphilus TaxID=86663 RepID=A0ABY9JZD3_9BACI|nr:phenylalanine--tRNA ligase subunit beta [Bacillus carboniphilus]WLR44138.1 phenylalanine--tRNA ligase subunit beta [Bacillus carboniphilus]